MASILNDYVSKGLGLIDLQNELQRLTGQTHNKYSPLLFTSGSHLADQRG